MTRLTCYECGATATHEDLLASPGRPVYMCRHGAMGRDPATIRRLTVADFNMTREEQETAARLAREARKAARL